MPLSRSCATTPARRAPERYDEVAGEVPDTGDQSVAALIADLDQAEWGRDTSTSLRSLDAARASAWRAATTACASTAPATSASSGLRATPSAIRCIDCQTRHEKTFAVPGAPSL
jgi:hypothetical protein